MKYATNDTVSQEGMSSSSMGHLSVLLVFSLTLHTIVKMKGPIKSIRPKKSFRPVGLEFSIFLFFYVLKLWRRKQSFTTVLNYV